MSPKTARNLALVAAVALYQPCRNLLALLDILCRLLFHTQAPHGHLLQLLLAHFGPWGYVLGSLFVIFLPAGLLAFLLHRYLIRRDFAQVCADCAARKRLLTVLFVLFALLSIFLFQARTVKVPASAYSYPPPESFDGIESIDDSDL